MSDDLVPEELVDQLRAIEEDLRDRAYDRLREAAEAGAEKAPPEVRRLEQARRAVEKAIVVLAPRDATLG